MQAENVCPGAALYVPAGQLWHEALLVAAGRLLYVPALHAVHAKEPLGAQYPGLHPVQEVCPGLPLKRPLVHAGQLEVAPAAALAVPALQGVQPAEPAEDQ